MMYCDLTLCFGISAPPSSAFLFIIPAFRLRFVLRELIAVISSEAGTTLLPCTDASPLTSSLALAFFHSIVWVVVWVVGEPA